MTTARTDQTAQYWTEHLHDMAIARHPVGTREFFDELWEYHFDKQHHLSDVVDFAAYKGAKVLDVGCGVGTDALRFALAGAEVTGVDISERAIGLARENFRLHDADGKFVVMDARAMELEDDSYDFIYAHGILPYTDDGPAVVRECHRVLKPGGSALFQTYNRRSWLYLLWKLMKVELEHEKAPHFRIHAPSDMVEMTQGFSKVSITTERFPVKTRLHKGMKGLVYNGVFVTGFNAVPNRLTRPYGWHVVGRVVK